MKNRKLLHALWCIPLMAGCATNQGSGGALLDIQPVYSIRHSSEKPEVLYQVGRYYQGQKRYDQALAAYERALKADPAFAEAQNGRGVIYARQGKYDQAIAEFKAALEHAPRAAHIHNNLGYAFYLQGQYENAAASMEQAVALDPSNRRTHNNLGLAYAQIGNKTLARQESTASAELAAAPAAAGPQVEVHAVAMEDSVTAISQEPVAVPQEQSAVPVQAVAQKEVAVPEPVQLLVLPKDAGVIGRAESAAQPVSDAVATPAGGYEAANLPVEPFATAMQDAANEGRPQAQKNGALRIEISNGNGVTGMAKKVGGFLKDLGYPVRRITNDKPFSKPYTYVYYRDGYLDEALKLRADIPYTLLPLKDGGLLKGIHVRVVLGKDMVQQLAHFESGQKSTTRLAASELAGSDKKGNL